MIQTQKTCQISPPRKLLKLFPSKPEKTFFSWGISLRLISPEGIECSDNWFSWRGLHCSVKEKPEISRVGWLWGIYRLGITFSAKRASLVIYHGKQFFLGRTTGSPRLEDSDMTFFVPNISFVTENDLPVAKVAMNLCILQFLPSRFWFRDQNKLWGRSLIHRCCTCFCDTLGF